MSLVPFNINLANAAEDFLLRVDTNQGTSYGSSQAVPNVAKLKQMRFRVPASNPDNVIIQVVLAYPLNNPNSILDSKWNLGTWIYGPSLYCLNDNTCSFILIVRPNYNQKAQVRILKTAEDKEVIYSDCPATYSVGKNENNDSVISYNLSITCLNIAATFASYTFSGYDIGFTDVPYQYTVPSYVINTDYYELAKQSYDRNGGKQGLDKAPKGSSKSIEVCETFTRRANSSDWEPFFECDTKGSYELSNCSLHPRADLQTYKNGEWIKIKTMRGGKTGCDYNRYLYEHVVNFKTPFEREYRWKEYGKPKLKTDYYYIKISQKLKLITE